MIQMTENYTYNEFIEELGKKILEDYELNEAVQTYKTMQEYRENLIKIASLRVPNNMISGDAFLQSREMITSLDQQKEIVGKMIRERILFQLSYDIMFNALKRDE